MTIVSWETQQQPGTTTAQRQPDYYNDQQYEHSDYDDDLVSLQGSNHNNGHGQRPTGRISVSGGILTNSSISHSNGNSNSHTRSVGFINSNSAAESFSSRHAGSHSTSTGLNPYSGDASTIGGRSSTQVEWGKSVDKRVRKLREYLLFMLVGATLFMSLTIYYTIFFEQVSQFEDQFTTIATQYLHQVQQQYDTTLLMLTSVSRTDTVLGRDPLGSDTGTDSNTDTDTVVSSRTRHLQQADAAAATSSWPFQQVPSADWPAIAASSAHVGRFQWLAFVPVVRDDSQRVLYEAYVAETAPAWIEASNQYRESTQQRVADAPADEAVFRELQSGFANVLFDAKALLEQSSSADGFVQSIYEKDLADFFQIQPQGQAPYYPVHQNYPAVSTMLNYNLHTHEVHGPELKVALDLFEKQHVGVDVAADHQHLEDQPSIYMGTMVDDTMAEEGIDRTGRTKRNYVYTGLRLRQPASVLYVAGAGSSSSKSSSSSSSPSTTTTADVAWIGKFRWIDLLQANDLTDKTEGMQIVLENSCRQFNATAQGDQVKTLSVTTFQIDENLRVQWLGYGDLHKSTLSYLEESAVLGQPALRKHPQATTASSSSKFHEMIGLTDDEAINNRCVQYEYELKLYPSQLMKDGFFNLEPVVYTVLVLVVFAITSMVFVGYDFYVDRRQRLVMQSAVRHHAIVSSLFPKTIRERLFKVVDVEATPATTTKKPANLRTPSSIELHTPTPTTTANDEDPSMHGGRGLTQRAKLRKILATSLVGTNNNATKSETEHSGDENDNNEQAAVTKKPSGRGGGILGGLLGTNNTKSTQDWLKMPSSSNHQRITFFGSNNTTTSHSTSNSTSVIRSTPIADLFLHTTVLFADIEGFTAWSSTREPTQVFILLENMYGAFDVLADKRNVFKVETIGDSYVAVTGLPEPQADHAILMAKFAYEMQIQVTAVTRELVVELGPDTADLSLRIGLHSGQVIAGVLRGQKSRFQLFGDTVNTAARMESTGKSHHIQCSKSTAEVLEECGKSHWLIPRDDLVLAKGKGAMQTFWVDPRGLRRKKSKSTGNKKSSDHSRKSSENTDDDDKKDKTKNSKGANEEQDNNSALTENDPSSQLSLEDSSTHSQTSSGVDEELDDGGFMGRPLDATSQHRYGRKNRGSSRSADFERHLDWNVDLLSRLLKSIIARQEVIRANTPLPPIRKTLSMSSHESDILTGEGGALSSPNGSGGFSNDFSLNLPREEYAECIHLPQYRKGIHTERTIEEIEIDTIVEEELRDYITKIACSYHNNPFHNYDHATHVTMSANKILNRVVAADDLRVKKGGRKKRHSLEAERHNYTYGITSDPLTHFACVFSAMIHDVDHPGVSNMQLVKERDEMADLYGNKSVAEQNSVDLAWNLLMDPAYRNLRATMFANEAEKKRFRQLLVNSVMATDIFDPELVATRNRRWAKAFNRHDGSSNNDSEHSGDSVIDTQESADLKATVVIEHIIQAADVSHTMQHWHVYQKWNRRLFNEMYKAYKSGRLERNPAEGWYKGELWFYDNYVIPLAQKLAECGVFGVSSDEFLDYAMQNRSEWEVKGESIVADLLASFDEADVQSQSSFG